MSYLAKKEEKAISQLFLNQARALVFRARFLRGFFYYFFGQVFIQRENCRKVCKQAIATGQLGKKGRVAAMVHSNDFSAAWKLSDYQIKSK